MATHLGITRSLLRSMRAVAHDGAVIHLDDGRTATLSVDLSRSYGRRRYCLSYNVANLRVGTAIALDVTDRTLWSRPLTDWVGPDPRDYGDARTAADNATIAGVIRPAVEHAERIAREYGTPNGHPVFRAGYETFNLSTERN